jgi:hypothetical protein
MAPPPQFYGYPSQSDFAYIAPPPDLKPIEGNLALGMMQELAPPAEAIDPPPDWMGPRGTYKVEKLGVDWDPESDNEKGYREEVPYYAANLVGSATDLEENGHLPCFDLDLPAHLEPSSTPGHFHLYINKVVSWEKYVNLLHAMCEAGLVSEKYVEMSVKRGQTFVRRPGVYKQWWERSSSS